MAHHICEGCEWVSTCVKRQICTPMKSDQDYRLMRAMHAPIERPDELIATPEDAMSWPERILYVIAAVCLVVIVGGMVWFNWPQIVVALN